jgi:hypothetical protein
MVIAAPVIKAGGQRLEPGAARAPQNIQLKNNTNRRH